MRFMDTCRIYLHMLQAPALTVLKFCLGFRLRNYESNKVLNAKISEGWHREFSRHKDIAPDDLLQVGIFGRRMWITP